MADLGDVVSALTAMNRASGAIDAANLAASNDPQVQDAPGAPVGSGLAQYYFQNNGGPLPPGLANVIATKQATALQPIAQDYAAGKIDQPTALMQMGQIKGEDPSVTIGKIAAARGMGFIPTPNPPANGNAQANPVAQANPALASMGGVQSAPLSGSQGDNAPNVPAPPNVSGSAPYPGLTGANGLLNGTPPPPSPRTAAFMPLQAPMAAMPANAGPVDIGTSKAESGGRDYNPDGSLVTSPKGAQAAMQVMPTTQTNPGFGVTPARDNSPAEINRVGVDYRNALLQRYGGNQQLASAAYNAGPGRVDTALQQSGGDPNKALSLLPKETQDYVPKVAAATQQASPATGMFSPAAMTAQLFNGSDPTALMKTGSELQKNAAETAMDTAKAQEAAEAAKTAQWTRGETGGGATYQQQAQPASTQPIMASDGKPLLPSLAKGVQFAPDPQHMPDFMPTLPAGATKAQQENAQNIAKTQYESASKQYEGFGTLQQSLSNEKYYTQRLAQVYQTMASPNAAAEYPEMAKTLYNLGFPVDPKKGLDGVQEALNVGTNAVVQKLKDASVGLDANHPMRLFGSEVGAQLENAMAPGLTPTARFNSIATALGLTNRNLEAIQSYNSPAVGGLGNRLDGGKTMPPTEFVQQFLSAHDPMDYRQQVVDSMPAFKGMTPSPNAQHIDLLKHNANNPAIIQQFEQKFGNGSAKQYLGGQ